MTSINKKVQFGGWNPKRFREIRTKLRKLLDIVDELEELEADNIKLNGKAHKKPNNRRYIRRRSI